MVTFRLYECHTEYSGADWNAHVVEGACLGCMQAKDDTDVLNLCKRALKKFVWKDERLPRLDYAVSGDYVRIAYSCAWLSPIFIFRIAM